MNPFFGWFSRRSGANHNSGGSAPTQPDLLEQARSLAREGKLREASDAYWKIKRKQRTPADLIEHGEILLECGDFFGAASMAFDALVLEPENARGKSLQVRVQKLEDAERRR